MWRILLESIKQGVVRPFSPDGPELPPERFRGVVMLNPDRCDHSAECVRACPTQAITLDDDLENQRARWEVNHALCLFCGLCEEACPRGAIALGRQEQLAVKAKDDLRVSVTLALPDAKRGG